MSATASYLDDLLFVTPKLADLVSGWSRVCGLATSWVYLFPGWKFSNHCDP